jgi:MFS family permease
MSDVVLPTAPAPAWKDRTVGLIVFGALQILIGVCALCVVFGMAAASEMGRGSVAPMPRNAIVTNIIIYGLFAAYFITAGVGSIRKRRWARALSLVVSAMWLVVGVISMIVGAILIPHLKAAFPASQQSMIIGVMFAIFLVIYVVLPLVLFLFYRSPHVRETCDARDPVVRWTDRVPEPILALVLLMAFAAISLIASASQAVLPVFGTIITGAPAVIIIVAFAGLCAFLSVQLYRLKKSAWWTLILLQVVGAVFAAVTLARTDMEKVYEEMGVMTPQLREMHIGEIYRDPMLWGVAIVAWIAYFAFLLRIRRYFDVAAPRTRAADGARPTM